MARIYEDKNGYVSRVQCGKRHGGNSRIAGDESGYRCEGCGQLWVASDIAAAQSAARRGLLDGDLLVIHPTPTF